jgi:alpha-N-arabinofuranosidase
MATLSLLVILTCLSLALHAQTPAATLTIDVGKVIAPVSPTLYGLMTEEINYSYDGGLYAELIRNRTFLGGRVNSWTLVQSGNSSASMSVDRTTGPSAALPSSLQLKVDSADAKNEAGISNGGYWGISLQPKTHYSGSFYAKVADQSVGAAYISLVNDDTNTVLGTTTVPSLSTDWRQYKFSIDLGDIKPSSANHIIIALRKPGTAWFNLVSLFPPTYHNRENGNRVDLMQKLAALKPTFLRFPGGNYLEGSNIANRFDWKKTIGPLVDRPTHMSPWRYQSSDGMGLLEFLYWCEDLKMQPVLAVYAGYSLNQEHVNTGADLEPYVQDALDEIEYVTGGVDTKWGAERAKDGHPQPFALTYVEVGNEDQFDRAKTYDARYAQFYKAIKAKYPHLMVIATAPVQSITPDVLDEHFYRAASAFMADAHHYDTVSRSGPKIFVGEWASQEGTPTPNFDAALGDAAWMTGFERNGDLIILASYAPLFANVNPMGQQWDTNMIGYDASASYGSPSYYAQQMFYAHLGNQIIGSSVSDGGPRFFQSVTRDSATGKVYLKLVNASSDAQAINVQVDGSKDVKATGTLIRLAAKTPFETNTITDPIRVVPAQQPLTTLGKKFEHTMPPYSIEVIELVAK